MNREPSLSERLNTIAELILPEGPMADIGTDHGFLPLYCLQKDLVPFAVLSDVNEGPLGRAKALMEASEVTPDRYSLRLGSGLTVLAPFEVKTAVIAGMGGELICRILQESPAVTGSVQRLVLQPRTRSGVLRSWLWENGWTITCERLARERGRLSQVFAAEKGKQDPYAYPDIPDADGTLMIEFLDRELVNIRNIMDNLLRSKDPQDLQTIGTLKEKAASLEKRREELWKKSFS